MMILRDRYGRQIDKYGIPVPMARCATCAAKIALPRLVQHLNEHVRYIDAHGHEEMVRTWREIRHRRETHKGLPSNRLTFALAG